ncbi:hypothetical protein Gotur_025065, partial [Gossypium turneri]
MAKKASKSKNDLSSSTSVTSAKNPSTASNHQMALRVKSSEKMKKTAEESVVSERERRPKSKSRPKSKLKKKTKIDAKMPKKPPTAFFYFFELWFLYQRILPASFVAEIECPVRDIKLTDFFIFLYLREDFRKDFQEQNPDIKSMRDV